MGSIDRVRVDQLLDALERARTPLRGRRAPTRRRTPRSTARGRTRTGAARRAALSARCPPRNSRPWLPVSATEWIASASIEAAPVIAKADELRDRDAEVGDERSDDRLAAPLVHRAGAYDLAGTVMSDTVDLEIAKCLSPSSSPPPARPSVGRSRDRSSSSAPTTLPPRSCGPRSTRCRSSTPPRSTTSCSAAACPVASRVSTWRAS